MTGGAGIDANGSRGYPSRMSDTAPAQPEPIPFQKFDALMRRIVSTPKGEVDRRMEAAKRQRQQRAARR